MNKLIRQIRGEDRTIVSDIPLSRTEPDGVRRYLKSLEEMVGNDL